MRRRRPGLTLATSLVLGYASPGGNKPLAFSGQLEKRAPQRLLETSRFVEATCLPGGLARFAPGFAIASARHETQYSRLFRS